MKKLVRLFWELFKISLFVVGGGYAIIVVADQVFGKKLKWLREGELLEHLPIFQMVPGLIAGNTAIYVGLKMAGRLGAAVALVAVALPSFAIFLGVTCGYNFLPMGNVWLDAAFLGLRSALTGLIAATLVKGWRKSVSGIYGYVSLCVAGVLLIGCHVNTVAVLLLGMGAGIVWKLCGSATPAVDAASAGLTLPAASLKKRLVATGVALLGFAGVAVFAHDILFTFLKFGCLGFGGGYVLVPLYIETFVGPAAPLLQLSMADFSNLMALTQTTPGPVSINAATFFGYHLGGLPGAAIATTALLLPSYFLLTAVLTGIEKWKTNPVVQGLLWGVKPVTTTLILSAGLAFVEMSVWNTPAGGVRTFHPFALVLALGAAALILKSRLSVMSIIFLCGALGGLVFPFGG